MQIRSATRDSLGYFSALCLFLMLAACNSSNPSPNNPGQGGGTPSDDAPQMLVLGEVQSPVFDELKSEVRFVTYDGSQAVGDYYGVVFDGDAMTPESVGSDTLIRDALRAEKWVLALDTKAAHKQEAGLMRYLPVASENDSPAYLVQRAFDATGHTVVSVYDYLDSSALSTQNAKIDAEPDITSLATASFVATAREVIMGKKLSTLQSTPPVDSPTDVPDNLSSMTVVYTPNPSTIYWNSPAAERKPDAVQLATYESLYTFNIYYDNLDDKNTFQWVIAEIDASANPVAKDPPPPYVSSGFANMTEYEKAWWQDQLNISLSPPPQGAFTTESTTPESLNNAVSVSSGEAYSIGFDGKSATGSFEYNVTNTTQITDWQVVNDTSGVLAVWNFSSWAINALEPYGCQDLYRDCNGFGGFGTDLFPLEPSTLSLGNMQAHTQAVWKTKGLLDTTETFTASIEQRLADTYCKHTVVDEFCANIGYQLYQVETNGQSYPIMINMAAVIPIPFDTLTFDPNPAPGTSTSVTATLTLKEETVVDTTIFLSSDNPSYASVNPTVIIPAHEQTVQFPIDISPDNIPSGQQSATANITVGSPTPLTLTEPLTIESQ